MVRLICVGSAGLCRTLELEGNEGRWTGVTTDYYHGEDPVRSDYVHTFSDIGRAKSDLSLWCEFGPVFTETEQIAGIEKLFPEGSDVVEHWADYAIRATISYRPKGYDVVWRGGAVRDRRGHMREKALLIRIPENGDVRCPKRFMGRVIGKKGVKINELSKKHEVKIHLVEIPNPE